MSEQDRTTEAAEAAQQAAEAVRKVQQAAEAGNGEPTAPSPDVPNPGMTQEAEEQAANGKKRKNFRGTGKQFEKQRKKDVKSIRELFEMLFTEIDIFLI